MSLNWKINLAALGVLGVPAFTGFPLQAIPGEAMPGVPAAWVIYPLITLAAMRVLAGPRLWGVTLSIAALVALPVVYAGATVSYLLLLAGWSSGDGQAVFSAHYVTLCLTMLTVVPLALNIVAAIPFAAMERAMLQSDCGVSRMQKTALMFLRVFNHIVFFVIPSTVEIVREERRFARRPDPGSAPAPKGRLRALIADLVQIGIEGICASIQYIPIWALEISALPEKKRRSP
jgi:hypothetical protein